MRLAASRLLHASVFACVGAACSAGEDFAPQTRPRTVVYVYVVGAARSLATTAANLNVLLCGSADAWADGLPVVPLLHVWANSSCDRGVAVVVPPFFAAALVNFTMKSLDGAMAKLVNRDARTSVERTRAIQFTAQLFHLYNLNRRAVSLLFEANKGSLAPHEPGESLVLKWRPDVHATVLANATSFLRACVTIVRDEDMNDVICILPTPKTKLVPGGCVRRRLSRRGVDFYMSTCCHPDGRGVLSDWVFVTKKRVLDAMDGHNLSPRIYDGGDRAEHRFCRLFVGSNVRLVWPVANRVVKPRYLLKFCVSRCFTQAAADAWAGNRELGLTSVRCPHGATPYNGVGA
jgi:hypothetical protein